MARKYIPVFVGEQQSKVYLDDLHRVHQILRQVSKKIPPFEKKKLKKKNTLIT